MTKEYFETKILFKEMPNLLLEAKKRKDLLRVRNPGNRILHASRCCLLEFTTRKLCSFAFKILKIVRINTKSSVKQYF